VTGALAVALLVPHLAPADGAMAAAQLRAEHAHLYRGVHRMRFADPAPAWDDDAVVAAVESHDPHQVKLVEACRRGHAATGDAAFVVAAQTVTRTSR
jgi:hypothetical protein